ncbi:biosynthetic-type acetolactate synthase large subunit [archaeon]|nr:biosynthetic-type acetolactate synthase large subunit [archaeon]
MVKIKGSEVIIECLLKKKVDTIFGITGGAVIPLYDTLYDMPEKMNNIMCRHEQGATHMAAGYARACGKPAVALATSGPGGTNLVTGIMDAYMDSTPMIAMAGQVPQSMIGGDAFQETDMLGVTMPVTKHNFQLRDPERVGEIMLKAYKIATEGRPGPVYIDLPKDVLTADVKSKIPESVDIPSYRPTIKPNPLQVKRAVEMMLKSERPLIIAGGGCIISNAKDELAEFSNSTFIPVTTTTMGKSIFPENHPLSLGVLGMHGEEHANYATLNTDCMIVVGCRFSDRITGPTKLFANDTKVIHADIDPTEIGKNVGVDIPIVGNAKDVLKMFVETFKKLSTKKTYKDSPWVKKLKELKEISHANEERDIKGMHPANVLKIFNKYKKESDIVATGVGQHQMFGEHFLNFTKPRTWITSGGAGTMGYGLPGAMGAKVAIPESEVYDLDGDGSFQMTSQELATAKQHRIKVTPMIMNNGHLGMVRQWLEIFKEKRYSGVVYGDSNPDFVKLAQAHHLDGLHVTRESEIIDALNTAKKNEETFVLDFHVDKEDNIFPMMPPGKGLHQIIGGSHVFNQSWEDVKNVR